MNYDQLLVEIQNYVQVYFENHHDPKYVYHNINHTREVARASAEIANHFQLNESDFFTVVSAAWFHDVGYMIRPKNHEEEGSLIAASFLKEKGIPDETINKVKKCILATRIPQSPDTLLEKIICDADLYHLGTDDFFHLNKLLRHEAEMINGDIPIDKIEWARQTLKLLDEHHYQTDYCRLLLDSTKKKNRKKLKEKLDDKVKKESDSKRENIVTAAEKENPAKKDKDISKLDRGVQTMFRVSAGNNQHLSRLADYKAHVMVSVNSIILSIVLGLILRKLNMESNLVIPTYLILCVCLLTIVFSVLAIRPTLPKHGFTAQQIEKEKINLLFFGNFYKMSIDDYILEMEKVMKDPDTLYTTLIKDTYSEGVVLAKKYRYIRISYDIFLYGIIVSVLAFVIATLLNA